MSIWDAYIQVEWRVGRKVGRTIYTVDNPDNPDRDGRLIGLVDSRELAAHIVEIHNLYLELYHAAKAQQIDGDRPGSMEP